MSTLESMRSGLGRTWDAVADGWRQLVEGASGALTRFVPVHRGDQDAGNAALALHHSLNWGLLAAELREEADQILVRIEVPGMDESDFDIEVQDNLLLVSGQKQYSREQNEGSYHMTECAYGRFQRVIPLPATVREDKTAASYKRGVLEVRLPKLSKKSRSRIKVSAS